MGFFRWIFDKIHEFFMTCELEKTFESRSIFNCFYIARETIVHGLLQFLNTIFVGKLTYYATYCTVMWENFSLIGKYSIFKWMRGESWFSGIANKEHLKFRDYFAIFLCFVYKMTMIPHSLIIISNNPLIKLYFSFLVQYPVFVWYDTRCFWINY